MNFVNKLKLYRSSFENFLQINGHFASNISVIRWELNVNYCNKPLGPAWHTCEPHAVRVLWSAILRVVRYLYLASCSKSTLLVDLRRGTHSFV